MPGMPVGSVFAVQFRGKINEQQWITSFQYQVLVQSSAASPVADLGAIVSTMNADATSLYNKFRLCLPATTEVDFISAQQLHFARSVRIDLVPTSAVGSRGDATTPNLSAVITKGTDSGDRGQVGSIHLPGVATEDQNDGVLILGLLAAMDVLGSTMLAGFNIPASGLDSFPVLYHPDIKDDEGHITRPWFTTRLTRWISQDTIRVMRRRTIGVGK